MSSYVAPTPAQIRTWTGVNEDMDRLTSGQLDTELTALISVAEVQTALAVTEPIFDATDLTSRRALALTIAVAKRVAAAYLRFVADKKVSGTQAPRVMELAAALREQADALEKEAETYDRLATLQPGAEGEAEGPLPVLTSTGVAPESISVAPSRKLELLDERDDAPISNRGWWPGW